MERVLRIVALVPARGGSKGLPGKNLANVGGVTLLGRAVRVGRAVPEIDEVVVSSDDPAILREAENHGAVADRRDARLAQDDTPTIDVVLDHLDRHPEIDAIVLLQPTSPLRAVEDVQACVDALQMAASVATVTECSHPPGWTFHLAEGGALEPVFGWDAVTPRRQEAEPSFRLNGAVYACRAERLRAGQGLLGAGTAAVVMPSRRSVDVDDEVDLLFASLLEEQEMRSIARQDTAESER